ncbi:MAG: hypothetical protein JWM37_487 [Candidatus Saccharibacteria bacterium]|nr:hypothetical protein [Candidatus Saccharibacteria bacterium]
MRQIELVTLTEPTITEAPVTAEPVAVALELSHRPEYLDEYVQQRFLDEATAAESLIDVAEDAPETPVMTIIPKRPEVRPAPAAVLSEVTETISSEDSLEQPATMVVVEAPAQTAVTTESIEEWPEEEAVFMVERSAVGPQMTPVEIYTPDDTDIRINEIINEFYETEESPTELAEVIESMPHEPDVLYLETIPPDTAHVALAEHFAVLPPESIEVVETTVMALKERLSAFVETIRTVEELQDIPVEVMAELTVLCEELFEQLRIDCPPDMRDTYINAIIQELLPDILAQCPHAVDFNQGTHERKPAHQLLSILRRTKTDIQRHLHNCLILGKSAVGGRVVRPIPSMLAGFSA